MTAACREACCAPPRMTVSELFERGFRRIRETPLPIQGDLCTSAEGHSVSFSLRLSDSRLELIRFQASTCATLIAYCELIAETLPSRSLEIAQALMPAELVQQLPGVPLLKSDRAALAVAGFRAAVTAASRDLSVASGEPHESLLHLRHLAS